MSWVLEVLADNSGMWAGNAARFATEQEATRYGVNLSGRWTSVRETRSRETDDRINAAWNADTQKIDFRP